MKNWLCTLALVVSTLSLSAVIADAGVDIIPKPVTVINSEGSFTLNAQTKIFADENTSDQATLLQNYLQPATGFAFESATDAQTPNAIVLQLNSELENLGKEGYRLSITPEQIRMESAYPSGLVYAIQSLRQLLPTDILKKTEQETVLWEIPCCSIEDMPRFEWRGFMIDSSRTFWSKEFTKRYIDLLVLYKMNVLHMHLVDDQG